MSTSGISGDTASVQAQVQLWALKQSLAGEAALTAQIISTMPQLSSAGAAPVELVSELASAQPAQIDVTV